ncbi:MAG: hypothetical protein HYZ81_01005 [Nitrospinae bacterium]|nr:hypothetical protein [Nitrospinota bacterium]
MTLLGTTVKLFSRGIRGIEGTLLGKALSLSGHDLEGLTLTFALHEGRLTFKDFKASAYGGEVEGAGTFVPSIAEGNLRLHIRRLHLGRLLAQLETRQGLPLPIPSQSQASPLPMSAEVSLGMNRHGLSFRLKTQPFEAAEAATFTLGTTSQLPVKLLSGAISAEVVGTLEGGGPKFSGTLSLEKVGVHPTWQRGQPLTFSFDIPFAFEDGLLEVPEFSLTVGDQVHIFLAGALSVGSKAGRVRSLALRLPPTETSSLQKAIAGLLPGALLDTHLSGGLEARVEMLGDQVQGEVRLEGVGTEGGIMTLKGVSGRIPLFQRLGVSSVVTGDGWPELSEQAFEVALQAVRQPSSSPSLTISSLSYAGFELEDLAVHFSSRAGPLAIDHFSFQGLGGSGRGRGVVEPFGGSLHLALLVEGLSLREICSRFPSIEGYIFGKVRGMLELSLPIFEPSQAIGRARFWAVKSEEEPRKVSKALIERLGGQSGGFSSLIALRGDRSYDHGLLEVTLKDRLLTFHNLEISNTVLFIKDLDIKVVPAYNTIPIQDLFDTIQETWKRVQP